jgi:hypothetical protein
MILIDPMRNEAVSDSMAAAAKVALLPVVGVIDPARQANWIGKTGTTKKRGSGVRKAPAAECGGKR